MTLNMNLSMNSSMDANATNGTMDGSGAESAGATIYSPIIMFLTGILGNLLALAVLHRTKRESQRLMFHGLVEGLVWNDLLGICLTTPVTLATYANNLKMPGGEHLCRFNGFVMLCFGISTPLIVSAMAIERFLFVKYTFFYTRHCPPSTAKLVIFSIWGFVLLFGVFPLFGFGQYVAQYPSTWCFLEFANNPPITTSVSAVNASYGYLYAIINLLLACVMVVCNLLVGATLSRVREYRRKHSTSSLNMSMVMDNDEISRMQAQSKRRKQKDIELQMICVMFAITTIFVVCWVPLMIHIIYTLANSGVSNVFLGLVCVRLASLNQILNPWLYVILRRALIVRVKKYCCRWRSKKLKKIVQSAVPGGRRHQYVHVGNRLCHRNNFVGVDANSQSLSDSMRKSLQKAIPAAMSLPDVMMVKTGRREMEISLPDIAKAQSFGGRVSHGVIEYNYESRGCYCDYPSHTSECSQCAHHQTIDRMKNDSVKNNDFDQLGQVHDSFLKSKNAVGCSSKSVNNKSLEDAPTYARNGVAERLSSKPPSGRKDLTQYRDFQSSIKTSSSSRERNRTDSQRSNDVDILSSIMSPSNRSSFHSQTGIAIPKGAMTQYIHMQKRDTHGNTSQTRSNSTKSHTDDPSNKQRREINAIPFSEDCTCDDSDNEFGNVFLEEDAGETGTSNSKLDNTTDCGVFSSNPTESVCFSDSIPGPSPNAPKKPDPRHCEFSNECNHATLTRVHQSHAEAYQKLGKQERTRSKSYTNDDCDVNSLERRPDGNPYAPVEEEVSSGVFSVESPTKIQEEAKLINALWESKNEATSDQTSNSKSHLKKLVRRIKSVQ